MIDLATRNRLYRKDVYRDDNVRIVPMSIGPGDDIGEETHDADQTTLFVAGEGRAVLGGHGTKVPANHMVVIANGTRHDIINKGGDALKLFAVHSPAAEESGISRKTKGEAAEAA